MRLPILLFAALLGTTSLAAYTTPKPNAEAPTVMEIQRRAGFAATGLAAQR